MNEIKPNNNTQKKKLVCDWMDKKKYLIHYRMLKLSLRHGMTVDKEQEMFSYKRNK